MEVTFEQPFTPARQTDSSNCATVTVVADDDEPPTEPPTEPPDDPRSIIDRVPGGVLGVAVGSGAVGLALSQREDE